MKKLLLSTLIFLTFFTSVAPNFLIAGAQDITGHSAGTQAATTPTAAPPPSAAWYNPGPIDFFTKVFDKSNNDIFGERYTYAQVTWIAYSLVGVLAGFVGSVIDIPSLLQQIQASPQSLNTLMDPKGKLAQTPDPMMSIISQFYLSPPASGRFWLAQKIDNLSIVKKAYAAPTNSFGYSSLQIFQPLWGASRNIAYSLIVIVLLAIAFAVMFRLKINPQLTVTVQSAIPKVVSALIFITFSYAIVGFLIDLMYLIFGAVLYGFSSAGGLGAGLNVQDLWNNFLNGDLFGQITNNAGVGGTISLIGVAVALIGLAFIPVFIPFVIGIFIAIIMFFVRVFIMLAQTYLSLLINLVFGPIIILAEAIPFIKASAMGWFMSIVADILIFLVVGMVFLIESLIFGALGNDSVSWRPPFLGFNPIMLKVTIWVGVWAMLPNVRTMVYRIMERTAAEVQLPREFQGQGETFQRSTGELTRNMQVGGRFGNWINRTFPRAGGGGVAN